MPQIDPSTIELTEPVTIRTYTVGTDSQGSPIRRLNETYEVQASLQDRILGEVTFDFFGSRVRSDIVLVIVIRPLEGIDTSTEVDLGGVTYRVHSPVLLDRGRWQEIRLENTGP